VFLRGVKEELGEEFWLMSVMGMLTILEMRRQ
jgi:hypothetical protein